jgi:hypothetical protein
MRRPVVSALLLGIVLATSAPALAGTEDARSHFTRGVELFKEGDFRAALIEFQRAYEAAPNYKVLYNLGQTSLELQDYAGALKAFRGYLDGGGREIPAARRTQVEGDLKKLESRVARVEVVVNVEGADISIDDVSVGTSPLREAILVGAGRRKILVTKAGLASVARVVDVAGGDKPRITIELVESQTQTVTPTVVNPVQPPPSDTQPPEPHMRVVHGPSTGFYIGLVATGALAVGTGVLAGLALGAYNGFEAKLGQVGVQSKDVTDARNQTRSFALATDIVGGVAIVAAVTTIILALTTSSKRQVREGLVVGPLGVAGTF